MAYFAPPAKTEISNTPSPSNAVAKAGFGKLWDFATGLLGTTGKPAEALAAMKMMDSQLLLNIKPTFSAAANALTIAMRDKDGNSFSADNPGHVSMRHATLGDAGHNLRKTEANFQMVISSGSTLGHTSARVCPIYIYLIDFAGALEVAVSGSYMGESGIFSTTAEGGAGAADNPNLMYSTTARTNVPFRLVGIAWINQTTAGTWVNLPSEAKQPPYTHGLIGEIVDYFGGTVPYGFYLQDGSNVSRTGDAAKLFGKVGTNGGVGDGSTTFGVGDSRRRVNVGAGGSGTGTLGNAVGNTGGAETHALVTGEMPSHFHTGGMAAGTNTSDGAGSTGGASANTGSNGSGTAHNNMQPSLVVTKMIRWLGDIT